MIDVLLTPNHIDFDRFAEVAHRVQGRFRFSNALRCQAPIL